MFCKNCGAEIKEGNTFCANCGQSINKGKVINTSFKKIIYLILGITILIAISIIIYMTKDHKENKNELEIDSATSEADNKEIDNIEEKSNKFIRFDSTAETGATYTITLEDVKTALENVCKENNIDNYAEFKLIHETNYNLVYESVAYVNNKKVCSVRVQVHNDYIVEISHHYAYTSDINFANNTGKEIFRKVIRKLFEDGYGNRIVNILDNLEKYTMCYIDNTMCLNASNSELYFMACTTDSYRNEKENLKGTFREKIQAETTELSSDEQAWLTDEEYLNIAFQALIDEGLVTIEKYYGVEHIVDKKIEHIEKKNNEVYLDIKISDFVGKSNDGWAGHSYMRYAILSKNRRSNKSK